MFSGPVFTTFLGIANKNVNTPTIAVITRVAMVFVIDIVIYLTLNKRN